MDKKKLKEEFSKEWEKHYKLKTLEEYGFKRYTCRACNSHFWSTLEREYCEDSECVGYRFIGNSPVKSKLDYVETWKKIENYFVRNGHASIKPYPTVARWRKDLYFNIASISNFQPYVVSGEIEPPANPLIVPQTCIRFGDISNVGVTGRHYTNFVMVGQHAFNNEKTGLFYWKEEAIYHDINYLGELGLPVDEITFKEDMWLGGGNFGPSLEYFCRGLELGNCVFQQYEITPEGSYRELKTRVIDMGAGLSRLCWITNPLATSYELVFPEPIRYLKSLFNATSDETLFMEYSKLAGMINIEENNTINTLESIAKKMKMEPRELKNFLEPRFASYAIADHTQTLLFTISDGMLPSNSGGGYNLRLVARRCFGFEEQYSVEINYHKLFELHVKNLIKLFPSLEFLPESATEAIEEEKKKYKKTKEASKGKLITLANQVKKEKKIISLEDLKLLYQSYGIPPETVREFMLHQNVDVSIPENFYSMIKGEEEKKEVEKSLLENIYPPTKQLCYDEIYETTSTVVGIEKNLVILDASPFYPEGGGQCGDSGYIENIRVIDTKKDANVVVHVMESVPNFSINQIVKVKVDKHRRERIKRNHTGAHLLHGAAVIVLGKHVWQNGSGKDDIKAHLDLSHYKRITDEELKKIETLVNQWIRENLPVKRKVLQRTEAEMLYGMTLYQGGYVPGKYLNIIEIGNNEINVDVEACGGTHVKSTGEIGVFKIVKRESVQDNLERITFRCGESALEYIQELESTLKESANVFSIPMEQVVSTCKRFFEEWKKKEKTIQYLYSRIAQEAIAQKKEYLEVDLDKEELQKILGIFIAKKADVVITNKKDFFSTSASGKAQDLLKKYLPTQQANINGNDKVAYAYADKL